MPFFLDCPGSPLLRGIEYTSYTIPSPFPSIPHFQASSGRQDAFFSGYPFPMHTPLHCFFRFWDPIGFLYYFLKLFSEPMVGPAGTTGFQSQLRFSFFFSRRFRQFSPCPCEFYGRPVPLCCRNLMPGCLTRSPCEEGFNCVRNFLPKFLN